MKNASTLLIFAFVAIILVSHNAFGWGKIAHVAIVQQANKNQDVDINYLGELPDAWGSYHIEIKFLSVKGVILPHWCWSHNVLRTGTSWGGPLEPTYANWDEPGKVMFIILDEGKIKNPGPLALDTAMSYSMHNAMDQPEHFDYFKGGTIFNWGVHHWYKERWADRVIASRGWGIDGFDDIDVGPYVADAELIHLAQRVFIKNRRYTDSDNPNGLQASIEVLPYHEIADKFLEHRIAQEDYVDDISSWSFRQRAWYWGVATTYRWSESELENRFYAAVDRVKDVYTEYQP